MQFGIENYIEFYKRSSTCTAGEDNKAGVIKQSVIYSYKTSAQALHNIQILHNIKSWFSITIWGFNRRRAEKARFSPFECMVWSSILHLLLILPTDRTSNNSSGRGRWMDTWKRCLLFFPPTPHTELSCRVWWHRKTWEGPGRIFVSLPWSSAFWHLP